VFVYICVYFLILSAIDQYILSFENVYNLIFKNDIGNRHLIGLKWFSVNTLQLGKSHIMWLGNILLGSERILQTIPQMIIYYINNRVVLVISIGLEQNFTFPVKYSYNSAILIVNKNIIKNILLYFEISFVKNKWKSLFFLQEL